MGTIIKLLSNDFPPLLNEITDPPQALYLEGALPDPAKYLYLTVVGSRRFSNYGREATETIITALAGYPIVIVSGLAIGIDTIVHKTALKAGLPTVAIPGSGLDRAVLHPPSNRGLAEQIVKAGGGLLAELEPKQPAGLHTFPQRNRLMAGIARGVLIIEANAQSGTLITARLTLDYNRDLYAVPGSIFSPTSVGTNQLIRQGAAPVASGEELLEALGFETTPAAKAKLTPLSAAEQKIIDCLKNEPLARDVLIRQLNLPTSELNSLLAILELKGWIKETMGEIRLANF